MRASRELAGPATFINPVYSASFPDPFVLKFGGSYYAYSTGFADDGNVFNVLRSPDLVDWTMIGGAMPPLEHSPPYYWAPEVSYDNGKFYLYYSVGNEVLMELRVAVSDRPDGGFVDAGRKLTTQDFAIDAHVFTDDDGQRYMFYATDFLEHSHIGTGTVVDRMIDRFTLEGDPRPVTRAKYDWQVYDPNRKEKGGVRWHTVEGPAVVKRKRLYYEMFSGGNWQNTSYGVSFAISNEIMIDDEWRQFSDGERVLPIMRTLPDQVIGPGHNCIVRGPNNRELYCVYHRWVGDHRVMAIDRMDFAGERIFIIGPSHTSQPAPYKPGIRETFRSAGYSSLFVTKGEWAPTQQGITSSDAGDCELTLDAMPESFVCEFGISANTDIEGSWGFAVGKDLNSEFSLEIHHDSLTVATPARSDLISLPMGFDGASPHLVRVDLDRRRVSVQLDDVPVVKDLYLDTATDRFAIFSHRQAITIDTFELTEGFEELFETEFELENNGWRLDGVDAYEIRNGELTIATAGRASISKGSPAADVEFAVNIRLRMSELSNGRFGIELHSIDSVALTFSISVPGNSATLDQTTVALPPDVQLAAYHQLRIVKRSATAVAYLDDVDLGEFEVYEGDVTCSVFAERVAIGIEMIRLTLM